MTCRNCKHDKFAVDEMDGAQFHWCKKYYDSYDDSKAEECESYEPKTNADKIRNMTDEELADFIQRVQIGDFSNLDYGKTFCDMCNDKYQCEDCLKLWLKQHVEGE